MQLYLQMGHGMQQLSKSLIQLWGEGHIIISPVNIKQTQLSKFIKEIQSEKGKVLFDPQIFFPHNAHSKLMEYDYWPSGSLSDTSTLLGINRELLVLNNLLNTEAIILPGSTFAEKNFNIVYAQIADSAAFFRERTDKQLYATLCLLPETVRNQQFIENIIDPLIDLKVDGFYIIPQPSNGEYINSDVLWIMGLLKLATCLKLKNRKVILGYSNHQTLVAALAHVDGIASGTYMNTRSFEPSKFQSYRDEDTKRKSTWYYLPDALSEYKATILDVAKQRGFLDLFAPQGCFLNQYSSMLFSGALPSSTNYNETNSFEHYLYCLHEQCDLLTKKSYDEVFDTYEFLLNNAENKIKTLKRKGIGGQNRDFEPGIEVNRIAMFALNEDYGLKLRFEWLNL